MGINQFYERSEKADSAIRADVPRVVSTYIKRTDKHYFPRVDKGFHLTIILRDKHETDDGPYVLNKRYWVCKGHLHYSSDNAGRANYTRGELPSANLLSHLQKIDDGELATAVAIVERELGPVTALDIEDEFYC